MSRFGTCRWAYQIQEMWAGADPERMTRVIDTSNEYTCQWLDSVGDLPPPIRRRHGGMEIRPEDCDACSRYEAVSTTMAALLEMRRDLKAAGANPGDWFQTTPKPEPET